MKIEEEQTKLTDDELSTQGSDGEEKSTIAVFIKLLLFAIGGVAIILSILVLLPMFFTYLSSGDARAPSEIHAADPVSKSNQNAYNSVKPDK
jgi:hypothetical protein